LQLKRFSLSLFALFLGAGSLTLHAAPMGAGEGQNRDGWDAVPHEFREVQRQGFRDGLHGAQMDFDNHRRPDVNNREEYRHPHVPHDLTDDYLTGYRRGYEVGVRHLFPGGVPAVMPWEHTESRWDAAPREFDEIRRQGFQDGLASAQRDFDRNQRPDAEAHEEFRHPHVAYGVQDDYREGYRRGYEVATHRLYPNGLPPLAPVAPVAPVSPWMQMDRNATPQMQRVGYLDGILAAGADFNNGLAANLDSHEEYRSSKLSFLNRVVYKAGYKTGYEIAMRNIIAADASVAGNVHRQGFLDGINGARRDYDEHRRPDMNAHEEFRHPAVPGNAQDEYQEGYRRSYEMAASYLF
jgi:hypothetical protein